MNATDTTIAVIIAALADLGPRISMRDANRARDRAADVLRPHVPAGLWGWLVAPRTREAVSAYARRATRYLIARCAEAGLPCPLRHEGAEVVGALGDHVGGSGPATVSAIETL